MGTKPRAFSVLPGGLGPERPTIRTNNESRERFGTSAFSAQTIWNFLTNGGLPGGGVVNLSRWLRDAVPERYQSRSRRSQSVRSSRSEGAC